jgi:hypothetical protein
VWSIFLVQSYIPVIKKFLLSDTLSTAEDGCMIGNAEF